MSVTNMKQEYNSTKKIAMRVSTVSIIVNIALSLLKLIAGILASSGAMISDAVHSASDVFSTIIVMIGVSISEKTSDKEHPYGHERLECIASILLAEVLALTGLGIGYKGATNILNGHYEKLAIPGILALIAAIISILTKEWMYWYTRNSAKKINSSALMADAWHHRSDALSSVGAFIGIFGARMGFPVLDSVASLVICVFIEKAAWDIFKDSIDKLIDTSCSDEVIQNMTKVILACDGVMGIDELKTRLFGAKIYVELEISADCNLTLKESHTIAENVHIEIERNFPDVKHCTVHMNPYQDENI